MRIADIFAKPVVVARKERTGKQRAGALSRITFQRCDFDSASRPALKPVIAIPTFLPTSLNRWNLGSKLNSQFAGNDYQDLSRHILTKKVRVGSQPPMALNLNLGDSAGWNPRGGGVWPERCAAPGAPTIPPSRSNLSLRVAHLVLYPSMANY